MLKILDIMSLKSIYIFLINLDLEQVLSTQISLDQIGANEPISPSWIELELDGSEPKWIEQTKLDRIG